MIIINVSQFSFSELRAAIYFVHELGVSNVKKYIQKRAEEMELSISETIEELSISGTDLLIDRINPTF